MIWCKKSKTKQGTVRYVPYLNLANGKEVIAVFIHNHQQRAQNKGLCFVFFAFFFLTRACKKQHIALFSAPFQLRGCSRFKEFCCMTGTRSWLFPSKGLEGKCPDWQVENVEKRSVWSIFRSASCACPFSTASIVASSSALWRQQKAAVSVNSHHISAAFTSSPLILQMCFHFPILCLYSFFE